MCLVQRMLFIPLVSGHVVLSECVVCEAEVLRNQFWQSIQTTMTLEATQMQLVMETTVRCDRAALIKMFKLLNGLAHKINAFDQFAKFATKLNAMIPNPL